MAKLKPYSDPSLILNVTAKAFPHKTSVNFHGKQTRATYENFVLTLTITITKTTHYAPSYDPFALPYLAMIGLFDSDFVDTYLFRKRETLPMFEHTFRLMCDPRVATAPAFRAHNPVVFNEL